MNIYENNLNIVTMHNMEIGPRFKYLREKKKLSQQDVADHIGQVRQAVQRFETPGYNPTFNQIVQYLSGIGVSVAEFFESNIPEKYSDLNHQALHEKLQDILDSDDKDASDGIKVNIDYIHSALKSGYRRAGRGSAAEKKQPPRVPAPDKIRVRKIS